MIITAPRHLQRAEPGHEAQRHAYNAAFDELGLAWHWDPQTYDAAAGQGPQGLRRYLESSHPHLLRAYDADFLIDAIEAARARCHAYAGRAPEMAPSRAARASGGVPHGA